ncbi:hypothetical protein D3C74_485600 [compost metagenome]
MFRDKETKRKYPVGSVYETDDQDRADFLKEFGFIGSPVMEDVGQQKPPLTDNSEKTTADKDKADDDKPDAATETKTDSKADKE